MLETFLYNNGWLAALIWAAIYTSDYYLTILAATLYRNGANAYITFEGSLELTPYYQGDVNKLRRFSPRFIRALILTMALILLAWIGARLANLQALFIFAFGMMTLMEAVVHLRHFRNLATFRWLGNDKTLVSGKIQYTRRFSLQNSSVEILAFAGFLVVIGLFVGDWFLLGGALGCANLGLRHWLWARKLRKPQPAPSQ